MHTAIGSIGTSVSIFYSLCNFLLVIFKFRVDFGLPRPLRENVLLFPIGKKLALIAFFNIQFQLFGFARALPCELITSDLHIIIKSVTRVEKYSDRSRKLLFPLPPWFAVDSFLFAQKLKFYQPRFSFEFITSAGVVWFFNYYRTALFPTESRRFQKVYFFHRSAEVP